MRPLRSWILNVGSPKAVRRVPINTISLTGEVLGREFESSLERDLIQLISWHDNLDWFQVQPCKIHFTDSAGRQRSYTPDLLVSFADMDPSNDEAPPPQRPILCEVKYREELARNWKELKPKFRAAKAYAKEQGWDFHIFTQDRIRTPFFKNVQFLWNYRYAPGHDTHWDRLLFKLNELGETTVNDLLDACYLPQNRTGRGEGIWTLWCMVARKQILCDLNQPLTMDAAIWVHPSLCLKTHSGSV